MAPKRQARQGARGPRRARGSQTKLKCAYRQCRSQRDVKNIAAACTATRDKVNTDLCRRLSQTCQLVRFCCVAHKKYCTAAGAKRGSREGLDQDQIIWLFRQFQAMAVPWVAVLMLLQIIAGDRASCMCNIRRRWLRDLSPRAACPATLAIEKVNGKTRPRILPITASVSTLLHRWLHEEPLQGADGSQWPFEGQDISNGGSYLLPGLQVGHGRTDARAWDRAVTSRAYLYQLRHAANLAMRERAVHREQGLPHVFDDYPLELLGTHSMKHTGLSIMKDVCSSTVLVGAVAGTTAKTVERVYDQPTRKRQQRLVERAFEPMVHELARVPGAARATSASEAAPSGHGSGMPRAACARGFCTVCSKRRQDSNWLHCPWCGHSY